MTIDFYRWDNIATNTLLYPKLLHSPPPHSHSILHTDRNSLNSWCKFFFARRRTVSPIRQKFAPLNSKANFDDSKFARVRSLSLSIGRFLKTLARMPLPT